MPKEWPAQPRFLEVLKTLRSASKVKLDELESLALADARQYYKHAVAILVKQLQVKRPRQRVPIPTRSTPSRRTPETPKSARSTPVVSPRRSSRASPPR